MFSIQKFFRTRLVLPLCHLYLISLCITPSYITSHTVTIKTGFMVMNIFPSLSLSLPVRQNLINKHTESDARHSI